MATLRERRFWFDGRSANRTPIAIVRVSRWSFLILMISVASLASAAVFKLLAGSLASLVTGMLAFSLFPPIAALSIALTVSFRGASLRRRARRSDGQACESCLYDLRGLAPEGSCPECGIAYNLENLKHIWSKPKAMKQ